MTSLAMRLLTVLSGASIVIPSDTVGLMAVYNFDQATALNQASSGVGSGVADADPVGFARDVWSNTYHLTQSGTDSSKPTFDAASGGIAFTTDDFLECAALGAALNGSDFTYVFVISDVVEGVLLYVRNTTDEDTVISINIEPAFAFNQLLRNDNRDSQNQVLGETLTGDKTELSGRVDISEADYTVRVNGVDETTLSQSGTYTLDDLAIGYNANAESAFVNVTVHRLAVYNVLKTPAQIDAIASDLQAGLP